MDISDWGYYHPFLVHFPVVLFLLATACAIASACFDKRTVVLGVSLKRCLFYISHVLVILGALAFIPTVLSGLLASWQFPASDHTLIAHRRWAYFTLAVSLIHAAIRVRILLLNRHYAGVAERHRLLALLIFNTLLVLWTADFGGALTHGRSFMHITTPSVTKVLTPYHDAPLVKHLNATQVEIYLSKQVEEVDVKPIFEKYGCMECHSEHFDEGYHHLQSG